MKVAVSIAIISASISLLGCSGGGSNAAKKPTNQPDKLQLADTEALEAVKSKLRDPGSAQFRNVRRVPVIEDASKKGAVGDKYYYCGEVNSKNAFGGYVGFTRFSVLPWAGTGANEAYGVPGKPMSVYVLSSEDLGSPIGIDPFCGDPGAEETGFPVKT